MAQNLSNDHINLTMLTDFYEITMANGYFANGFKDTIGYFDMFFRKVPDGGGFAIMAGVEQLVNYLSELSFTQEDIDYLRSKHIFREEFLVLSEELQVYLRCLGCAGGHADLPG